MSLPTTVVVDPAAATTAAPVPLDDALYGSKTGKGAKTTAKRTTKSGKALPLKDAKDEQVMSISTKAAKTEAVPVLPINDGTS